MDDETINRILGNWGDGYEDPLLSKIIEDRFETKSLADHILLWIRRWKITNSKILQKLLCGTGKRSKHAYHQAIKRLMLAEAFLNVRVKGTAYYFHKSQEKHWKQMINMDKALRTEYMETNTIAHHIAVQDTFTLLCAMRFSIDGVLPIIGPEGLRSGFKGEFEREPDLSIVGSNGEIAIEVERNVKSRDRWREKWLEYECDPKNHGAIYFVAEDETLYNCLRTAVSEFFIAAKERSSPFWIGIALMEGDRIGIYSIEKGVKLCRLDQFLGRLSIPKSKLDIKEDVPFKDRYPVLFRSQIDEELNKEQ
jgi:hypothetical protein